MEEAMIVLCIAPFVFAAVVSLTWFVWKLRVVTKNDDQAQVD